MDKEMKAEHQADTRRREREFMEKWLAYDDKSRASLAKAVAHNTWVDFRLRIDDFGSVWLDKDILNEYQIFGHLHSSARDLELPSDWSLLSPARNYLLEILKRDRDRTWNTAGPL